MPKRRFEKILLEAVDEGLSSLGESPKQAVYFHLEKGFKIRKHEIPYRINDFAHSLDKIFGQGADFLEILIMKRLHEKIGGVVKWPDATDFTFVDYVAVAKRNFLKHEGIRKTMEVAAPCDALMEG